MKKLLLIIPFLLFEMICPAQLAPDRYDTSYENGYIVTIDSNDNALIKPIIKMAINVDRELPCSLVYVWTGKSRDTLGWYDCISCSSFYIGRGTESYKGDTLITTDCKSYVYSLYKNLYFIPGKEQKGKKRKLGKEYVLTDDDYYGSMDTWVHRPVYFYID